MPTKRLCIIAATMLGLIATTPLAGVYAQTERSMTTLSDGVLKVCLGGDSAPIVQKHGNDGWSGWDADFLARFADSVGLRFEPVTSKSFSTSWNNPGKGVCDIAGGGITYTAERAQATPDAVWSDAYLATKRAFIVRDGEQGSVQSVIDLANRTVVVWPNTTGAFDLQRRIEKDSVTGVTVKHPENTLDALKMVRDGQAVGFDSDLTVARYLIARYPGLAVAWVHPMMWADGSESDETYSYVVRKADTGLVEALNAYIAENRATYGWPN